MSARSQTAPVLEETAVSLEPLAGKRIAILGYGNQGRAHALNLRDGGFQVVVGARAGGRGESRAREDGLSALPLSDAAATADLVVLLLPDEAQGEAYRDQVRPALRPGAALAFAHGFAIAFGQVAPEPGRACFLVAPKGQGDMLREAYAGGGGLPGLLAVTGDSPAGTWELAAAYAKAIGCLRGGGYRTTFREECIADLFGEQAVLCGGMLELIRAAFDTLVARGYGAENAYFECVHEVKLIADLLHRHGLDGLRPRISRTAAYGGLTRGPRLIGPAVRAELARQLDEIESGAFAREFLAARDQGLRLVREAEAAEAGSQLARTGRALRARLDALGLDRGGPAPRRPDE
jgi:ketol-acid reductoisomerase